MSGKLLRILLAIVLSSQGILAAEDWTRFRGPNGTGVSESTGLPTEFGPSKNVLWKTEVPFGRSSPVVAGDRIFLTATEGDKLITLCLDRATGRVRWRKEVVRPRVMKIYKGNDGASPTPVTDGKNVYAFFPELGLISYDASGKERWRLPLGPFNTFYGLSASPILAGDTLLLLCDARLKPFLLAVEAATGKTKWRVERKEIRFEGYTSPLLYRPAGEAQQVVVLGANRIDAYAVSNGEHLWWVRGLAYYPIGSPVLGKDMLVASTYGSDQPEGPAWEDLLKMDASQDGKLSREEMKSSGEMYEHFDGVDIDGDGYLVRDEWEPFRTGGMGDYGLIGVKLGGSGDLTQTSIAWHEKKTYPSMPTPIIYKDVLFIVKTGGIIGSFDPATGKSFKVDRSKDALGEYYSSPVAADGKIYFVSENGKVTVAKADAQWEILAVNDLGEDTHTTPAIAGKQIFIRTHKALYAFGIK